MTYAAANEWLARKVPPVVLLGLAVLGWSGVLFVSPGQRISTLEAEQQQMNVVHLAQIQHLGEVLDSHLVWARSERSKIQDYIEALARLKCLENRLDANGRRLLIASRIPCDELLANRIPGQ